MDTPITAHDYFARNFRICPPIPHKTIVHEMLSGIVGNNVSDLRGLGAKFHDLYFFKDIVVKLWKGYTEAQRVRSSLRLVRLHQSQSVSLDFLFSL
jgi:hypothetical protein